MARRSALTYKAQAGVISVVEPISMEAPKTKAVVALADALKVADKRYCWFSRSPMQTFSSRAATSLRTARAGAERLHVRRDERFGDRDGGRR